MKKILLPILAISLFSCAGEKTEETKKEDKTTEVNTAEKSASNEVEDIDIEDTYPMFDASTVKPFDLAKLDEGFDIEGDPTFAITWEDKRGTNILINSEDFQEELEGAERKSLRYYSKHFLQNADIMPLVLTQDFVEDCQVDITLGDKMDPILTDLDEDGIAEVTVLITKGCRGGMDELELKVLMHEEETKYALRGMEYYIYADEEKPGDSFEYNASNLPNGQEIDERGRYMDDNSFKDAPKEFLEHAVKLWKENAIVKF